MFMLYSVVIPCYKSSLTIRKVVEETMEQFRKMEKKTIPEDIDYDEVPSLRIEARQKLKKIHPASIGQASRISGVSPADISELMVHLSRMSRMQ